MNKMFFALVLTLGFGLNSLADEGVDAQLASDVQLDSVFEAENNTQLQNDQQFAAKDVVTSERELKAEKNRIQSLKAKNERLNSDIQKHVKLAKERRAQAARENIQTRRLEEQVQSKEAQLEKIKITNVELRTLIQNIRERQHKAMVAQNRLDAAKRHQMAVNKALKEKRQKLRASKVLKIRTAGL